MRVPIRRGSVYWIPDTSVNLPPRTLKDRTVHPKRPFLVVSNDARNSEESWPIVLGFPLTTSDAFSSEFDVRLAAGQASLPEDCWVQVEMMQPLAKSKIMSWIGALDSNAYAACLENLFAYMDL